MKTLRQHFEAIKKSNNPAKIAGEAEQALTKVQKHHEFYGLHTSLLSIQYFAEQGDLQSIQNNTNVALGVIKEFEL